MGTLTSDVARAIRETRRGRLDFRLGRDGAVRAALGRCGMPAEQLAANIGGLVASLLENKWVAWRGRGLGVGGGGGVLGWGRVGEDYKRFWLCWVGMGDEERG